VKIKSSPATVIAKAGLKTRKARAGKPELVQGIIRCFATLFRGRTMTQRTTLAALRRSFILLAITISFFACSDSNPDTDEISSSSEIPSSSSETPSSSSDTDEISSSSETPSSSSEINSLLLNFTSDYVTGLLRWMNTNSASLSSGQKLFDQDSKVFANGKDIFVLERIDWGTTNTLSCIQADKIEDGTPPIQKSLESGSTPYEVAVAGSTGYIALYDLDYVQTFDINTCALGEKIDLPIEYANASSIKANGNELLVVAQRLENFSATKPGLLIIMNATTKELIDTVQLNFYNPIASVLSNGKLYVSSVDDYFSFANAGVEVVDLATRSSEVLVTGAQLGGGAQYITLDETNQILYTSVYVGYRMAAEDPENPVKPVILSNKSVGSALPSIEDATELVFDGETGRLFIADRGFNTGGLKVYDTDTQITATIEGSSALPPYSLAIARW